MNDVDDMLAVSRGDSEAFERIVNRHSEGLINHIRYGCGVRRIQDAEDVAQETFIRLFGMSQRYSPQGSLTGLLRTIAKNVVIDLHRKSKRNPSLSEELDMIGVSPSSESDRAATIEASEVVGEIVSELPFYQQFAVEAMSEGYTIPQISEMFGCCESTTKSRLRLARSKVVDVIEDLFPDLELIQT